MISFPSFLFHATFFYTKLTACDWNQETLLALLRQEDCCLAILLNQFPLTTSVGIFDWLTHLSSRCPHALRLLCCPPRSRTSRTSKQVLVVPVLFFKRIFQTEASWQCVKANQVTGPVQDRPAEASPQPG